MARIGCLLFLFISFSSAFAAIDEIKIYINEVTLKVEQHIFSFIFDLLENDYEMSAIGLNVAKDLNKHFGKSWFALTGINGSFGDLEFEYEPNSLFWFSFREKHFYLFRPSLESDCITDETRSTCKKITTFNACIANPKCGWCLNETVGCDSLSFLQSDKCHANTFEPINISKTIDVQPNDTSHKVDIQLTEGMTRKISITFSLLPNPLDLYYLMDFSGSMGGDKNNLISLATSLMNTISNITADYRLGLGSFIDKPMSPFGAPTDYEFKNRMPLTSNATQFANIVSNTAILSGGDAPEGQGDAILQSAVCLNEIGWRNNSRRILLVATDDDFHRAGDGVKVNLTKPNDGKCHLNSSGDYTESLTQDYPSVQQIKEALENNSITTIFAVRNSALNYYRNLSTIIRSVYVGELQSNSQNILQLITQEYDRIQSRLELEVPVLKTTDISVKFHSSCHNSSETERSFCENLPKTGSVKFIVSVNLKSCPKNKSDRNQTIRVSPVGLPVYVDIAANLVCGD